jgi:Fic family protein
MPDYQPPFSITPAVLRLVADVAEATGRVSVQLEVEQNLRLRRLNRIRTIQGSLAIEGNTLSTEQITAILDGKRVIAPPREIAEAHNAIAAYEAMSDWQPTKRADLLAAHRTLMKGLLADAGRYRSGGVGVMPGGQVIHMAPPADRVDYLMNNLLGWLKRCNQHPLIASCVFHYEFEFIHPFADGNGRMGRLWQTLILSRWNPLFANLPVESLIHENQPAYYQALQDSTAGNDSAPLIEFLLAMILAALNDTISAQSTPQVTHQVTPQVENLLGVLIGEMSGNELQIALGLSDRKSFRERYLLPALKAGLVEMTLPDKPKSRLQKYRIVKT